MATERKYLSLDKLGLYDEKIKKVISDGDAASLASAKSYADGLAVNYDAAGAAATALADAKVYADGKDTAIAAAKKAGDDAAAAAAVADGKAVAAQTAVDELEAYVGTFTASEGVDTVVKYIDAKTANIASDETVGALADRVTQAEADIDNIEKDYLKAADKTEIEGKITAVEGAVATEKSRAEGVEGGLDTRIKAIEDDYLTSTEKAALEASIKSNTDAISLLTNGASAEEIDGVNDLIQYVKDHGTEVTGMQEDIAENAGAIAAAVGRIGTLEGDIADLETAVAAKAEQSAVDEAVAALEAVDEGFETRIAAVEAELAGEGEGTVAEQISTAKQEAIDAAAAAADTKDAAILAEAKKYADDEDAKIESRVDALETASATHALASDVTTLAGKVTTAEGAISTLQTEMDSVEAKAAANETAIGTLNTTVAGKAAQTDLNAAVARIEANETAIAAFVEISEAEINELFA